MEGAFRIAWVSVVCEVDCVVSLLVIARVAELCALYVAAPVRGGVGYGVL